MEGLKLKKVEKEDREKVIKLGDIIQENLVRKEFFLPLSDFLLDNYYKDDKFITYGFFDKDEPLISLGLREKEKLVAFSLISKDESDLLELKELLNLNGTTAELGASMVHPDYRGKNLMLKINEKLLEVAKEQNIKYIVATAHPDNISSNSSLNKLGLKKVSFINRYGVKPRNVYLLEI